MVGTVSVAGRSTQRRPIGLGRSRLRRDLAMIEFSGPTDWNSRALLDSPTRFLLRALRAVTGLAGANA